MDSNWWYFVSIIFIKIFNLGLLVKSTVEELVHTSSFCG